jgi:hypothetical protein
MSYNYYDQGFDHKKHLALVVLRDPVSRWVSGMGQILVGNSPDSSMHIDKINWDQITDRIYPNNHTQLQHEFFANIPRDRIIWFRCENHLENKFVKFLHDYNVDVTPLPPDQDRNNIFNITSKVPEKVINNCQVPPQQEIVDKIRMVLDCNPKYVRKIKNLYREDYKLLNSVPYYDPE